MGDEENADEIQPEIIIQPEQMAGVWANFAVVSHSPYEFTLDFVRLEFSQQPPRGIVVSRISLSPKFIDELIEALQTNWQSYAEKAMPQEVYRELPNPRDAEEEATPTSPDESGVDGDD